MFSLVVATLNRVEQLERLFESLLNQTEEFEVILVDQNEGDILSGVVGRFGQHFRIEHVRVPSRGVNVARNIGADRARAEIIAFPDDDCWYNSDTLATARRILDREEVDGAFGIILDQAGRQAVAKFPASQQGITGGTTWSTTIEAAGFFKSKSFKRLRGFDERLGPGPSQRYGAHEIDDLVLRGIAQGMRFVFDPDLMVRHEQVLEGSFDQRIRRAYSYGLGMGYVMHKHHVPLWRFAAVVFKPLAAQWVFRFRGDQEKSEFYEILWRSRLLGWQEYAD